MSTLVPLDSRQARITRHLVAEAGPESMAASSLPAVRRAIRASMFEDLEGAASDALGAASATEVRSRFEIMARFSHANAI